MTSDPLHLSASSLDREENPCRCLCIPAHYNHKSGSPGKSCRCRSNIIYRCLVALASDSEEMLQKVAALWVYVYQHIITTKLSSQSEMKDRVGKISAPTKLVQESFFDTAAVSGSEANPVNVNVQWVSGLTRR